MQTRSSSRQRIEDFNLEELSPLIVTMADQRTMAQLLQAPIEGYEDAIVVPAITADNFKLKHGLLTLVQNKQFFSHAHVRYFNKITSTLKFPNVPNTSIKLMLFSFSLEGVARIWLEKEPPRPIFTWDDLVSKFINQFFPPSKTTNLRNEITNFEKRFDESFNETWDIFKIFFEPVLIMVRIMLKISKISQKPGNIEHKIGSLQQKSDQQAFFSRNQAMKPKCQKNQSSGSILANYPKSK
nr:reverse transcriptase domain-containing protein [Tanacetum cinerariifolium]